MHDWEQAGLLSLDHFLSHPMRLGLYRARDWRPLEDASKIHYTLQQSLLGLESLHFVDLRAAYNRLWPFGENAPVDRRIAFHCSSSPPCLSLIGLHVRRRLHPAIQDNHLQQAQRVRAILQWQWN